ncbi:hypothetical protein BH18ACT15_BH18ACT15_11860 [soil metagenome]
MTDRLWDVDEVAAYLGTSTKTVYRHAARLGASKAPGGLRFRKADVDRYVEQQRLLPKRQVVPLGRRRAS